MCKRPAILADPGLIIYPLQRMKNIIIIDDDPAIQDSMKLVFECGDYNVVVYPDAGIVFNGGLQLPDIFIIDKQLSGIDGLDVCRYIKDNETSKKIPVIMMSASPSVQKAAQLAGANAFIEKPFTVKRIREMVYNLLHDQGH